MTTTPISDNFKLGDLLVAVRGDDRVPVWITKIGAGYIETSSGRFDRNARYDYVSANGAALECFTREESELACLVLFRHLMDAGQLHEAARKIRESISQSAAETDRPPKGQP
jgi:hypothetical protein